MQDELKYIILKKAFHDYIGSKFSTNTNLNISE
jgi:hypothetical protein